MGYFVKRVHMPVVIWWEGLRAERGELQVEGAF